MSFIPRLLCSASAFALLLSALALPSVPPAAPPDEEPQEIAPIVYENEIARRAERLHHRLQEVRQRAAVKQAIAREVAGGRLPLAEAGTRFHTLAQNTPGFRWEEFRRSFPGDSDEERHCWAVLARVEMELAKVDPVWAAWRLAALQAQLKKEGTFHLPQ